METIAKIKVTKNTFIRIQKSTETNSFYTQLITNDGETGCQRKTFKSEAAAFRYATKRATNY